MELHVLGVDSQDFHATNLIWHPNVNFVVEAAEAAEGLINELGRYGSHNDHVRAFLQAVHQGEQLRYNASLDLSVGLLTLRRDGIDLVYENDRRGILLRLLEGLAQIRLRLTSKLGHDLGAVDQEEKRASFVGDSSRQQRLAATGRAVHQDAARRLDTDGLEQGRVAQGQLNQLANLRELLAAAADVVVADVVHLLFILAVDGVALAVNDGVWRDDAARLRVGLDHLELDLAHATFAGEEVALVDGAVGLHEVRLQEHLEQVARDALDGVVDGEPVNTLAVLDVLARVH